jgi:hypothetical protein
VTSVGSAISVTGLVRGYGSGKNRVDVLQGLDMDVQSGFIYGLLGHQAVGRRPFSKFHSAFCRPNLVWFLCPLISPEAGLDIHLRRLPCAVLSPTKPDTPSAVMLQAVKSGEVFTDRLNWWD